MRPLLSEGGRGRPVWRAPSRLTTGIWAENMAPDLGMSSQRDVATTESSAGSKVHQSRTQVFKTIRGNPTCRSWERACHP